MSVVITNRIFKNAEFTPAASGIKYPNTGVLSKVIAQIDFYTYLAFIDKRLQFTAVENTIENVNDLDFSDFIALGLRVGMSITFEDTVSNNFTFTITELTSRKLTVLEAVVTELDERCSFFDDTPVTALDFYYNLVPNNLSGSTDARFISFAPGSPLLNDHISLTDKIAIQRFTASGIDSTVTGSTVNMRVASESFGWVTNTITNEDTGETSEVTIIGMGIVAHKQQFRITQKFHVAPFALREQFSNFQNKVAPDYFQADKALKYICRIDGKFSATNPDIPHTGSLTTVNGLTHWLDQNNIKTRPDYFVESITYKDDATALPLERLDLNKVNKVLITIKSRAAQFDNGATKIILDFLYLSLNEGDYINTPDTTLRQNFMNDRKLLTEGTGGNGEYNGTDYQVLTQIVPTWIDEQTMEIEFKVDFSTFLKKKLKAKEATDRNYAFIVTTQDSAITSNIQSDRVPVLCDVQNMDYDQTNPALIEAVDTLRAYHFPDIDVNPKNTVAGWEGDSVYVQFPFRLETSPTGTTNPTIMQLGFQVVVKKTGEDDFLLQEKIFNTSLIRKLDGIQTIDLEESLNIIINEDDPVLRPYFTIYAQRATEFDSGTKKGFIFSYPFTLLYEFWAKLIQDSDRFQFDIFDDIENPTKAWSTLQRTGWVCALRFIVDVKGYDDFVTSFDQYWNIDVREPGEPPDGAPLFESTVKYELYRPLEENHLLLLNGIERDTKTLITRTYLGDFSTLPTGTTGIYAYIFADLENIGGINNRRFASTEFDSEEDSPFTAPPYLPEEGDIPDESRASANVRINIFNFDKIIVETIYDDTKQEWSKRAEKILIYPRLGFMIDTHRRFEDGELHLWDDGEEAKFET